MKTRVFIDGSEGTTGLRIRDRLQSRNDIELLLIDSELRKDKAERARISNAADIVFLCLPDAAAREAAENITGAKVIDASTAHRTTDGWAYGFPELSKERRDAIRDSAKIAVPGCHASGYIAAIYPLVAAGVLPGDYPLTCHSITGYSGGGKAMIDEYRADSRDKKYDTPRQYALTQRHKHLPEIKHVCGLSRTPMLNPVVCDYYEGMLLTVPLHLHLLSKNVTARDIREILCKHYSAAKLIDVLPFGGEGLVSDGTIDAAGLAGSDRMEILVCGHEEQAIIVARFDNLGKGASGAAVQCMNISCGLDELTGLEL